MVSGSVSYFLGEYVVKMTICLTSDPMECTNHARAEALGSSLYTGLGVSFIVKRMGSGAAVVGSS